jgi:hypothetical protein
MNSDNEMPRDLAVSKSMSRSSGRRRMATRAVRCRDSERCRGEARRRISALLGAAWPCALAGMPMWGIRSCKRRRRYNRVACRGGYTASACDHQVGVALRGGSCTTTEPARLRRTDRACWLVDRRRASWARRRPDRGLGSGRDVAGLVELSVPARTVGSVTMAGLRGLAVLLRGGGVPMRRMPACSRARHEFTR